MHVGKRRGYRAPLRVPTGGGIALCVIGRMENRYAVEFVEHYLSLGFDKIYVCDNNRDGEERFEDVLQPYIDEHRVTIVDYRNRSAAQCPAYAEVYERHCNEYRWMAFFDFDEFLEMKVCDDIHELMDNYAGFDCVLFNWMNYGDNGLVRDDGRDLQERFTKPLSADLCVQYDDIPESWHVKCIVRGGIRGLAFLSNPHIPSKYIRCCNTSAEECEQKPFQKPDYSIAYLKHYITKTVEEWASVKCRRGGGTHRNLEQFRSLYTGRFFKYNVWTQEKEDIFRQTSGMPPFQAAKHRNVVIVNYNTQELTDATIMSLNRHTPGCKVFVFDNSDKKPFVNTFGNVEVIDNTKGQFIDFNQMLDEYPDRVIETWVGSNYGSAKHCKTVDICCDLFPDGFLLMDSDILVKKDITPFFDASCIWTGLVGNHTSRWGITVPRVLPYICYINVPMMREHGIRYFNGDKMYALTDREPDKAYDTGAWFYEDCNNHGLPGHDLQINDYILHFDHGSWLDKSPNEWLDEHSELWKD